MSNKGFLAIIAILVIGSIGLVAIKTKGSKPIVRLGISHPNQGQRHIQRGEAHEAYNSDPASSGPHYNDQGAPTFWGVYTQEVPAETFVHNEEHGGIVVTYNPTLLPADQLKKLQALFVPPYSVATFKPTRTVVTPRAKDTKPIELAAWTRTLSLDKYDEKQLMQFYLTNVGKAPENGAGPSNAPINQAAK